MISLNSLIPGQECEILAVAADGDCLPHCVSLHFNLVHNNELNIRYVLANKIAIHMDEVVSLARDNAKVSFNLMNWFLSLRERDNKIGTGSQPILQSSILQKSGLPIDVDIFFTQYKLTLNEALRLLHDFTKLSAAHAKHDSSIYFDKDSIAQNLWFDTIHLDLMIFFRIVEFGCIMNNNKNEFKVTTICKSKRSSKLTRANSIFLVCSKKRYQYLHIELNDEKISVFGGNSDENNDCYEIEPIAFAESALVEEKQLVPLCFSKFKHVVRA